MSRMSWRAVPGPEGPALLAARGRDAALGTVVVVLTVGVFAAVGDHGTLTSIQRLDDAWPTGCRTLSPGSCSGSRAPS